MANAGMRFDELRFVIRGETTEAYALITAIGDAPLGVQGWHFKAFPASANVLDILKQEVPDAVTWPLKAP
jgi:hypothetical protein